MQWYASMARHSSLLLFQLPPTTINKFLEKGLLKTSPQGISPCTYYHQIHSIMVVVKRTVRTSHPAAFTALKALASIVSLNDKISLDTVEGGKSDSFSLEMTVVATDPFSKNDVSYSVSGFLACARAICKAVPDCGLWGQVNGETVGESDVESWVEKALALITPAYVVSEDEGKFRLFIF
jgi:hypothetical protein